MSSTKISRIWDYHALIVGFKIKSWGSWVFAPGKMSRMNNWSYQRVKAPSGDVAHVQDTALLKIYARRYCGPDPEILRIKASADVQDTARWFIDKYGMELEPMLVLRKGEKQLLGSQGIARILGRVKTDGFYVDKSGPYENLEEQEDSYAVESILDNLQRTPARLEEIERQVTEFKQLLQGSLQSQVATSNAVMYIGTAIKNQTEILGRLAQPGGERGPGVNSEPLEAKLDGFMDAIKVLVDSSIVKTPKNARALDKFLDEPETEVEILQDVPRFLEPFRGAVRALGPFRPGSRIYLNDQVARLMIKKGMARGIQEDTARTG